MRPAFQAWPGSCHTAARGRSVALWPTLLVSGLLAAALVAIFAVAPTERSMGPAQRIVCVHVSVAWLGLIGFVSVAAAAGGYLVRRDLAWDEWAQSAAESGWVCCTLTLVTGSLWARAAWNTWWTWDPRLSSAFVLWLIYCGYLLVRSQIDDPHGRARISAVIAVLGLLDVPLVAMATRWFRGMHPVAPRMEPSMRAVLLCSVISFSALFVWLVRQRREQLRCDACVATLEHRAMQHGIAG